MYAEGEEALFWADVDECAQACQRALENEGLRERIAAAGHARIGRNGHYNENILHNILAFVATLDTRIAEPA
jgi:hypothetical protein